MSEQSTSPCKCARVHFPAEQINLHNSEIIVEEVQGCENCYDVHLGFLKLHHEYMVEFDIGGNLEEEINCDPLQSLYIQLLKANSKDGGHHLQFSLKAEKEKLMTEEVVISCKREFSKNLKLIFHARVLGEGKGTPALKNGVHLVKGHTDDSHASDWNGFD